MTRAPRIVRWTLPARLLTLVVGGYASVAASGMDEHTRSDLPTLAKQSTKVKRVTVHSGDAVASIARRATLAVIERLELNPDVDPRLPRPGQRLKLAP